MYPYRCTYKDPRISVIEREGQIGMQSSVKDAAYMVTYRWRAPSLSRTEKFGRGRQPDRDLPGPHPAGSSPYL